MKAHRLFMALGAVALCAAVVIALAVPDPYAVVSAVLVSPHMSPLGVLLAMPVALPALRTQHADLVRQAEGKRGEIKDGMLEADVRRIEGEHEALVRQAEEVQRQITEAEASERTAALPPGGSEIQQAVQAGVAAERSRVASIREIGQRAGMAAGDIEAAVTSNSTVEAFRTRAFDELAQRQTASATSGITISRDERDTMRAAMRDVIAVRMAQAAGVTGVQMPEHARAYASFGLAELAAEATGYRGHLRTPRQVVEVFQRAFHSTSDFPAIFSDAVNVRLLARYQAATPTYRLFCARMNTADFRTTNVVRAGDFPALQPIEETGDIKAGTFGESKEQHAVKPYGVRFGLSRQMLINDQIGAIEQMLGSWTDRVLDWENGIAFAALVQSSNTGPTLLTDNKRMFHTDHDNHVTSGTAIGLASVGLGRAAMMKKTSLDGIKLNLAPAVILTGPDRLTDAEQLVATINPTLIANVQTDWIKRLMPAGDANITGNHWYLFADVSKCPCFVYGNLEGFEAPRLSFNDPFTVQGIEAKAEHDFGVSGTDFRGAYHNAGAAPA